MSLINQLLQDLDKRRSQPAEDVQLPEGTRATPVPARTRRTSPSVWVLAVLACAFVAALYVWQTHSPPASVNERLLAAVPGDPAVADKGAVIAAITQAQVEASLMAPVFQLSNQLASPPAVSRVALNVDSEIVAPRKNRVKTPAQQSNRPASKKIASASVPAPQPQREPKPAQRPQTTVAAATASNDDATPSTPVPRIAKAAKRPVVLRSEEPEETEIPILAEISASPIARQTRQMTSYERAEIEFRKGVANLRHGRLTDAEAFFRLANEEDRSHVAARQALVGILVEVGRNADAEEVLSESLRINPRQPHEAMVLARLQVERGDLEAAIRTLESIGAYAGSDAGYMSFLAAVFQRASRHEDAAKQYRNALALMPRNAIWLMGLGISLRALGENDQAKDAFGRAANTGKLSPELQAYVVRQYTELRVAAN